MANFTRKQIEDMLRATTTATSPDIPAGIILDCGNSDSKAMLLHGFGDEIVFPQWIREVDLEEYRTIEAAYKNRKHAGENSFVFQMDGKGWIVGDSAMKSGLGVNSKGTDKYSRNRVGVCLAASMLQLLPDGHSNVETVILHPVKTPHEQIIQLAKSIRGKYKIMLPDGSTVEYNVNKDKIVPIEEGVAAFQSYMLTTQGAEYVEPTRFKIERGMQYLIVDVGGYISSFIPGIVTPRGRPQTYIDNSTPIQVGIQTIADALFPLLRSRFKRLQGNVFPPYDMLYKAIQTKKISIAGSAAEDCEKEVNQAMGVLFSRMREAYVNIYGNGIQFDAIIVSGGGGAASFDFMKERLFDHENVFSAENDMDRMRYSAVRGAAKGWITALRGGKL